ncbi:MAG: saccharopine dehydrogenase family protein [Thermoplasmata archaeon]
MISVVGLGNIGSMIARELSNHVEVIAVDSDRSKVEQIPEARGIVGDLNEAADIIKRSEAAVVALPGQVAYPYVKKLLGWGVNVIDISYSPENPFDLDRIARSAGALYIPDCGFAPGLSNMLAYRLYRKYAADEIEIIVGGLPENPTEPFLHSVTWSVEGLIDEYTRKASVISKNSIKSVNSLDEIGSISIEGYGDFEYFTSDGLRTLLSTVKVKNLSEKTIRVKGHLERMKFLQEMGYFSDEKVGRTSARKISEHIFGRFRSTGHDLCILLVRSGDASKHSLLTARGTESRTAMSLLTGIPAASVSRLVVEGKITGQGTVPPELITENDENYSAILQDLTKAGAVFDSNF